MLFRIPTRALLPQPSLFGWLAGFLLFALAALTSPNAAAQSQHNFEVTQRLDIFNTLYRQLDLQYVDTLDAKKHIDHAIRSMLLEMDPYTEYYTEDEAGDLRQLSTGKYAGIGSPIIYRKSLRRCVFSGPYEGKPAQKAGIRTGDIIIAVDGKDFGDYTGKAPNEYSTRVTEALRGEPGTSLELTVRRPGEKRLIKMRITRETISLPNITLAKVYPDGVGYVALSRYTEHTATELRAAVLSLFQQGATSLVLDLRGNGGGMVSEAVKIVNFFIPKGKEVLSMKGRNARSSQTYTTESEPILPTLPLAILVDYGTASAAEITAGALQDYDRALIVGRRTYGKGLVQQPIDLVNNTSAKITVAKYFIPSGRCIQAYDFKNRNADGQPRHLPDSLAQEFRTAAGRIVRDGGGILPDVVVQADSSSEFLESLATSDVFADFCVRYRQEHPTIASPEDFDLSDADYDAFLAYAKAQDYRYESASNRYLKALRAFLSAEGRLAQSEEALQALEESLRPDIDTDFALWKKDIKDLLARHIVYDYYYERGLVAYGLRTDPDFAAARRLLLDPARLHRLLNGIPEP